MKKLLLLVLLLNCFLSKSNAQFDKENKELDKFIEQGMKDWEIPGLAVAVVKGGKVIFKKSYGVKELDKKDQVDNQTLFSMASTTKAIVAMALGILVDEGKLSWEDKVIDHVPAFKLSDAYITREARVKDLLTHNLGLPGTDGLWVIDKLSTDEIIDRMQYAPMAYSFRSSFIYQNIMYGVAGEVIKAVSGKSWDQFVNDRILVPLEMKTTKLVSKDVRAMANKVTPHIKHNNKVITLPITYSDAIGPAGMIWSSIDDISNYLRFISQNGVYQKDTLIKETTFNYLFKPHTLIPEDNFYPTTQLTKPHWTSYGLGWFQQDYKGVKVDFHTGSLPGLIAINGQLRDHKFGVYVFANMDHAELRHAIMLKSFDLYALGGDRDWNKEIIELYKGFEEQSVEALKKRDSLRVKDTSPTLSLESYVGKYTNELYGSIEIKQTDKGELQLVLNDYLTLDLSHWHYDTFMTSYLEPFFLQGTFVDFDINAKGEVRTINMMGSEYKR